MALNFPNNPQSGDTYIGDNGVLYTYDGVKWSGAGVEPGLVLPTASTTTAGVVKIDGTTITIEDGVISANVQGGGNVSLPGLSTSSGGNSEVAGTKVYTLGINTESESSDSIELAVYAGGNNQPAISLGRGSSDNRKRENVVAIGNDDVGYNSLPGGVYVGHQAGWNDAESPQGLYSIVIGANAAYSFATNNSITLNATGNILNPTGSGLFVKPIRSNVVNTTNTLYYNAASGEVTYGTHAPVTVGNTAQGIEGSLWYNTEDGRTYVYALDTWIDASPAVVPGNMVGYGQDGNITLNEDARINYANGASIINSVYGDTEVSNFLSDYTGNIAKIGSAPLAISAADIRLSSDNETWRFTSTGNIIFPDGSQQATAYTGGGGGGSGNALVNGAYTVALQANGVLTLGGTATISNASEEFRLWADNDITVYRNGQDGYGVKAGNIEVYTDNGLRTLTNSQGFELKTGNIIIPNDKGVVFANGVNILSSIPSIGNITFSGTDITGTGSNVTITAGTTDWTFYTNGNLTFPSGAGFVQGDSGQLKTNDGTTLALDFRDTTGRGFYTNNDGFSIRGNGSNTWKFGSDGNLTVPETGYLRVGSGIVAGFVSSPAPVISGFSSVRAENFRFQGNGVNILSDVVSKTTGSWTVTTGTNTYSFTVPESGTYQLWVDCNIPNGILVWNATATVTNSNVPVVGAQYAWVYNGGGLPVDFVSIPNQFIGTANTIVRSNTAPSVTTNRFDFGINNTSGGNVTVSYGYIKIS